MSRSQALTVRSKPIEFDIQFVDRLLVMDLRSLHFLLEFFRLLVQVFVELHLEPMIVLLNACFALHDSLVVLRFETSTEIVQFRFDLVFELRAELVFDGVLLLTHV